MRLTPAIGACALVAVGGCDCTPEPVTEILVEITSTMQVPDELATLDVKVESSRGGAGFEERLDVHYEVVPAGDGDPGGRVDGSRVRLPVRIGIVPATSEDTRVRVLVTGRPGPEEGVVVASAALAFVRGRALELPLRLSPECGGVSCNPGETCQAEEGVGLCVPETIRNPPCALFDLETGLIQDCDPNDEVDAGIDCANLVCPPGSECSSGACVSNDPCELVDCDEGLACSYGDCVDATLDQDGDGSPAADDCDDHDPEVLSGSVAPCTGACGEGTSTCAGGEWQPCTVPEQCDCTPGDERDEACGRCGTATRTCNAASSWDAPGACEGEGDCLPDSAQTRPCEGGSPCSLQSRTCRADCTWEPDWGDCSEAADECEPGQTESPPCGNCGTETRTCTAQCLWGTYGDCAAQGACAPDATEEEACGDCGTRTRSCDLLCAWGAWSDCAAGACTPGEPDSRSCGNCGSQARSCAEDCNWGAWSACTGEGACAPNATESQACGNCGSRSRTCAADCSWGGWGACGGQGACAAGATETGSCGNCGTHTRSCLVSCSWNAWSACIGGDGECAPGVTAACCDPNMVCTDTCEWPNVPCSQAEVTCSPADPPQVCGVCQEGLRSCQADCNLGPCVGEGCRPPDRRSAEGECVDSQGEEVCNRYCGWDFGCCDYDQICDPSENCNSCPNDCWCNE